MLQACLFVTFISIASFALADAPAAKPVDPETNAATWYRRAFDHIPMDQAAQNTWGDWETVPLGNAEVDTVVGQSDEALRNLHAGTQCLICYWGLDMSKGPMVVLPHLNHTRELMCLANLRARVELGESQPRAAVDDVCDAITMARHVGNNGILISLLVDYGIERSSIELLAGHLKELNKDALDELAARLRNLPDNATISDGVDTERQLFKWWIVQFQNADPNSDAAAVMDKITSNMTGISNAEQITAIQDSGGTVPGVIQKLNDLLPYFDAVQKLSVSTAKQSDVENGLNDLNDQFKDRPFAKMLLASCTRFYDTSAAARTRIVMLKAAMAIVQNGPGKIGDFTDPINHVPLTYKETPGGIELSSTVQMAGKPVTLIVGVKP